MDPKLRGGKTPYSEARVFPPLKPLPFLARLRANALRTRILLFAEGKCNEHGMQCSKIICGSTGMEAENASKKHLRGTNPAA